MNLASTCREKSGRRPSPEEIHDFQRNQHCENPAPMMASIFQWILMFAVVLAGAAAIFIWAFGKDAYPVACEDYRSAECVAAVAK